MNIFHLKFYRIKTYYNKKNIKKLAKKFGSLIKRLYLYTIKEQQK